MDAYLKITVTRFQTKIILYYRNSIISFNESVRQWKVRAPFEHHFVNKSRNHVRALSNTFTLIVSERAIVFSSGIAELLPKSAAGSPQVSFVVNFPLVRWAQKRKSPQKGRKLCKDSVPKYCWTVIRTKVMGKMAAALRR